MKTLKFKTNINCGSCVAKVTPFLNGEEDIVKWEVDIENPDKILSVQTESLDSDQIEQVIRKTGFKAEAINPN